MKLLLLLHLALFFSLFNLSAQVRNSSADYINKGVKYFDEGNYKLAIDQFKQVSAYDTNAAIAEYELALCYTNDSVLRPQGETYIKQVLMRPNNNLKRNLLVLLGNNLDLQKKYAESEKMYDSIAKMYPNDYSPIYEKAASFFIRRKFDEAIEYYQKALLLNASHFKSNLHLGICYMKQGRLTEAYLALQTAMLLHNNKYEGNACIASIANFTTLTDSFIAFNKNKKEAFQHEQFDEIDELLLSKIAFSSDFKSKASLDDKLFRQCQVILEKIKYDPQDKNFTMQYYVPFYEAIQKNDLFDALLINAYSGMDISELDKLAKRKSKEIDELQGLWAEYRSRIIGTRVVNYNDRQKADINYFYFPSEQLYIVGSADLSLNEKGQIDYSPKGYIKLYKNGILNAEGNYKDKNKNGTWKYYYDFGGLRTIEEVVDGKLSAIKYYNKEGVITVERKYDLSTNKEKELTEFRNNGTKEYTIELFDKKSNQVTYFHENDKIEFAYKGYKKSVEDGEYEVYNENGTLRRKVNYKGGEIDGELISKNDKGVVVEKGVYKKGKKQGEYLTYFDNGKLKDKYTYDDGSREGPYEIYNEKGNLTQIGNYKRGKLDGEIKLYDEENNLVATYFYDKNELKRSTFAHPELKAQSLGGRTLKLASPIGTIYRSIGTDEEGNYNGPYVEYYTNGKVSSEGRYKAGNQEGEWKDYFSNGKVKATYTFKNGNRQGKYKSYHYNGQLYMDGQYEDGNTVGEWIEYYSNGNTSEKYYYYNGRLNGPKYVYAPSGKLSRIDWYSMGYLTGLSVADTAGNLFHTQDWVAETNSYSFPNSFGKKSLECGRKSSYMHGPFTRYYNNGKISEKSTYHLGNLDGAYVSYNLNGSINDEGSYKKGERVGKWIENDEVGRKIREIEYDEKGNTQKIRFYLAGKLLWEEEYFNNEKHGKRIYYSENNKIAGAVHFSEGYVTGYSSANPDGSLSAELKLKKGEGKVETNYANGSPALRLNYSNGAFEGKQIVYYENGKVADERDYKDNLLNGQLKKYYSNGAIMYQGTFVNDENVGEEIYQDNNGKTLAKFNYIADRLDGIIEVLDTTSGKIEKYNYSNGILIP